MPKITIGFALVLCAIGLFGYFRATTANPSLTSLIPFFVGDILLVCGILAMIPKYRMHAMHVAAGVGLLGFIAAAGRGFTKLGAAASDDPTIHRAPRLVLLMAIVCLIYVIVCVSSFISARRRREQSGGSQA